MQQMTISLKREDRPTLSPSLRTGKSPIGRRAAEDERRAGLGRRQPSTAACPSGQVTAMLTAMGASLGADGVGGCFFSAKSAASAVLFMDVLYLAQQPVGCRSRFSHWARQVRYGYRIRYPAASLAKVSDCVAAQASTSTARDSRGEGVVVWREARRYPPHLRRPWKPKALVPYSRRRGSKVEVMWGRVCVVVLRDGAVAASHEGTSWQGALRFARCTMW